MDKERSREISCMKDYLIRFSALSLAVSPEAMLLLSETNALAKGN